MFQEQHVVCSKKRCQRFFCFVFVSENFRIFLEQTPQQPITELSNLIFLSQGIECYWNSHTPYFRATPAVYKTVSSSDFRQILMELGFLI